MYQWDWDSDDLGIRVRENSGNQEGETGQWKRKPNPVGSYTIFMLDDTWDYNFSSCYSKMLQMIPDGT